jgi:type II secretory pathway component HofQ
LDPRAIPEIQVVQRAALVPLVQLVRKVTRVVQQAPLVPLVLKDHQVPLVQVLQVLPVHKEPLDYLEPLGK